MGILGILGILGGITVVGILRVWAGEYHCLKERDYVTGRNREEKDEENIRVSALQDRTTGGRKAQQLDGDERCVQSLSNTASLMLPAI